MGDKTSIEWTDATWSPVAAFRRDDGKRGWHCEKVSAGCKGCYAERLNGRKLQVGTGLPYTRASRDLVEAARRELKGKQLACWCAPLPCHGDVLAAVADGEEP